MNSQLNAGSPFSASQAFLLQRLDETADPARGERDARRGAGRPGLPDSFGGERHQDDDDGGERDHQQKGEFLPDPQPIEHRRLPGTIDRTGRP